MFVTILVFVLILTVVGLTAVVFRMRARQNDGSGKAGVTGGIEAVSLSDRFAAALKNRPGDFVAVIAHVVVALVIIFGVFQGLYDWTSRFFIAPFPWGLMFVAALLTWIGVILHRALKGTYTVLKGLGVALLFLVTTCVFVQTGRIFGKWAGWNIFGADPHTYTSRPVLVGTTEDHAYEVRVPMQEEYHTTTLDLRKGQVLKLVSITSDGADISGLSGDGYQGCNARGAVADTGDGVLRNLIAGTEALKYEAKLFSMWRRRPANNPVKTDEISWNVPGKDAPYGAVLFELNGEKRFLEEGAEVKIDGNQTLGFFINLERTKFRLNAAGKPRGAFVVKFEIL